LCVSVGHVKRLLTDSSQLVEPISSPGLRPESLPSLGTGPGEQKIIDSGHYFLF